MDNDSCRGDSLCREPKICWLNVAFIEIHTVRNLKLLSCLLIADSAQVEGNISSLPSYLFLFLKRDILTYIKLLKRYVRRTCREKDLIPDIYGGQRPVFINRFLEYFCIISSEIRLLFLSKQKCIGSGCEFYAFLGCIISFYKAAVYW